MSNKKHPKVIVTGVDSWRDDVGANFLPNCFKNWNPDDLAVVYTKAEKPNLPYSNFYYQISENDVVHTALKFGKKCGQRVECEKKEVINDQISKGVVEEQKRYNFFRRHRWTIFYLIREFLWSLGSWKSKELDKFIEDFKGDTMFFYIYPYCYMNLIQVYIAKKAGLRGVAYIADDNYSYKSEWYNPMFLIRRFFVRRSIRKVMKYADELLVIAPILCDEFKNKFKLPTRVFTKGITSNSQQIKDSNINKPIKMVYTGNLFIGRDKTLINVIGALKKINKDEIKIELYIYCHVKLKESLIKKLNVEKMSFFMGPAPVDQVLKIQETADIVLFIEGMDLINKNKARLSFSTKLTDYFKTGKCIFAVGPKNIAPIDYLLKNDCAIVSTNKKQIEEKLKLIVDDNELISSYGKKSYEVGIKNHSEELMQNILCDSLQKASNKF